MVKHPTPANQHCKKSTTQDTPRIIRQNPFLEKKAMSPQNGLLNGTSVLEVRKSHEISVPVINEEGEPRPPTGLDSRGRHWFLTWNNYQDCPSWLIDLKNLGADKYMFQEEKGEEGTPHIQGVFSFKNQKKWSELRGKVPAYWKKCRNINAAKTYCSKVVTRNGKTYCKGYRKQPRDPLAGVAELYPYQKEILEMIKREPDDRKIYWYYDRKGNVGKTTLVKHLCIKHKALVLGGANRDALYGIAQTLEKKELEIILFDIPRTNQNKLSYQALENAKNGIFFSPKYESGMCVYDPPHVVVFANALPDFDKLSEDRWIVKEIDSNSKVALNKRLTFRESSF